MTYPKRGRVMGRPEHVPTTRRERRKQERKAVKTKKKAGQETECKFCEKPFHTCGGARCFREDAKLPNCDCRGVCNECMFNYSRNTSVACCGDENCQNREFFCPECHTSQNYNTASNLDLSHKLWGKMVTETNDAGETRSGISYDY